MNELPLPPVAPQPLVAAVEALLFAQGEPVTAHRLAEAVGVGAEEVERALAVLALRNAGRGVHLVAVAGAWQLRTAPEFGEVVARLRAESPIRPTRAALEVLAAVAWRQPITRAEIDAVRGVDSQGPLRWLLDRDLCRRVGRRADPGRPSEYGTTDAFLVWMGLSSIEDLPTATLEPR